LISIIHPSRSRPELARKTADSWLINCGCDFEYILSLDEDDPNLSQYNKPLPDSIIIINDNKNAIQAINQAALISTGEIIIVISDDFLCFPDWGKKIEYLMEGKSDWILKTHDWKVNSNESIQDWIITLPVMDRVYYERFNFIYNEEYRHMWCDTEMTCVAELTGRKVVSEFGFTHLNDGESKIVDYVSKRADATFEHGRRIFTERKRRNFDLPDESIVAKMTTNYYTGIR
jgi:glycosyltransferase involved in cell wall biosynthesis